MYIHLYADTHTHTLTRQFWFRNSANFIIYIHAYKLPKSEQMQGAESLNAAMQRSLSITQNKEAEVVILCQFFFCFCFFGHKDVKKKFITVQTETRNVHSELATVVCVFMCILCT